MRYTTASQESSSQNHVVLAGCGDLGTEIGLQLQSQGWRVTGLRRRPERHHADFPVLGVDLTNPGDVVLPNPTAVVVALTADMYSAEGYQAVYRAGLRGLHQMLGSFQPRILFVSSTSVLGTHDGAIVTEDTPPAPATATAEVLLAAEEDARRLFESVTVVRPAGIYGPGRTRTIEKVRRGEPLDHALMTNRIHRDDLAAAITAVLNLPHPPALLHAADQGPAPQGEVAAYIAARLGVPTPPDSGRGRPRGKRIDTSALHSVLGGSWLQHPSYREGYAAVLASA